MNPATWQLATTVFEQATEAGVAAVAIGPERYRDSGFTAAVLRGSEYRAGATIADRLEVAAQGLREPGPALIYVYAPELDMAAHAKGWESRAWTEALENLDGALGAFVPSLGRRNGLIVTADHGVMDIPVESHVLVDLLPGLVDGIRYVAGDPRCLQLHFESVATPEQRSRIVERWRASESDRAWVATREEAVEAGWFGRVRPEVTPRIGDLLVAARKSIAYYDSRSATTTGRAMIGQHGSWSPAELHVPLLRFGAFGA